MTKLASDQMAAKAEHAVLSTSKFPKGARQLHVQDGVILAGPARVVALVQVIRRHLVQTHTLRLSNDERAKKTAALYDFITSERCAGFRAKSGSGRTTCRPAARSLSIASKAMR